MAHLRFVRTNATAIASLQPAQQRAEQRCGEFLILKFVAVLVRFVPTVVILKDDCQCFGGLHGGDTRTINAMPPYGELLFAQVACDDSPENVFGCMNLKLMQLNRYWAGRRNSGLVFPVGQAGFLS